MNRKKITPRRGVPALIKATQKRFNELGIGSYKAFGEQVGLSGHSAGKLLKGERINLNVKTEALLRKWLDSTEDEARQHSPAHSADDRPIVDIATEAIAGEITGLLPLNREKHQYVVDRIRDSVSAALEMQRDASSALVSKLETALAEKDEEVILLSRKNRELRNHAAQAKEYADARFQLGRDVGAMDNPERAALQETLNKLKADNEHLRATIRSLSKTL